LGDKGGKEARVDERAPPIRVEMDEDSAKSRLDSMKKIIDELLLNLKQNKLFEIIKKS